MNRKRRAIGLTGAASAAVLMSVAPSWAEMIEGDDGPNHLDGTALSDVIHGRGGNDVIEGRGDWDWLHGDENADTLYAGSGGAHLIGGTGPDELIGGADGDVLMPEAGSDTMRGRGGLDAFYLYDDGSVDKIFCGGNNQDWVIFHAPKDKLDMVDDSCELIEVNQ